MIDSLFWWLCYPCAHVMALLYVGNSILPWLAFFAPIMKISAYLAAA